MGAEAREVTLQPEAASVPRASFISPLAFWVFLSVAALVLLGVIARLVRGTSRKHADTPNRSVETATGGRGVRLESESD